MEVIIITRRPVCELCDQPLETEAKAYKRLKVCRTCYAMLTSKPHRAGRLKEASR